jgi:hypothetical protein
MKEWKSLSLAIGSLIATSIAALAVMAMTYFQEALNERLIANTAFSMAKSPTFKRVFPEYVPSGFHVISINRPEALSLSDTVAECATFDYTSTRSIESFRKLITEITAWSANNSVSAEPDKSYEKQWDTLLLNTCYRVRSAMISTNAPIMLACINAHNAKWVNDDQQGISLQAESCRRLKTLDLIGTEYQNVAI